MYDKKYLKTKIKSNDGKINTDFHDKNIPKQDSHFVYISIIVIESVCKITNNFYPQVFLEECKYIEAQRKKIRYTTEETEIFDDVSEEEDSE